MMGLVSLKAAALERLPFFSYVRTQEGGRLQAREESSHQKLNSGKA